MRQARYLLVACLALPACGDEPAPEPDNLEAQLAEEIQKETGTKLVLIDCPDDPEEGDLCDLTAGGGLQAKVRITRIEDAEVDGEVVQP
jgi:hypothetical protein